MCHGGDASCGCDGINDLLGGFPCFKGAEAFEIQRQVQCNQMPFAAIRPKKRMKFSPLNDDHTVIVPLGHIIDLVMIGHRQNIVSF